VSGLGDLPGTDGPGEPAEAVWVPADGISPVVRTAVYVVGLVVGALATAATGITAAVAPDSVVIVAAVCGAVTGVVSTIAGGLGVAYRPTR
jgi:hypothetical protein